MTEAHHGLRTGWLRAAVLGANDGIVSTASLMVGVASASGVAAHTVLLSGVAGLVGGALSMAAGEYVSVSSQADAEAADVAVEREELERSPQSELNELAGIYVNRGLEPALALEVATALTKRDALSAHARDELGITDENRARPMQAAMASALAFALGAMLPLVTALWAPHDFVQVVIALVCLFCLTALGAAAARIGGASLGKGALRVFLWSSLAFVAAALVGRVFGAS